MKKILFVLAAALATMSVFAANVDRVTAQAKAAAFLKSQAAANGKMMASASINFVSQRTITNSANVTLPVMYIFNTADRFVIVSGEDRCEEILAVGDAPLDLNNIPSNMQYWLDLYQSQIEYLQDRPGMVVEKLQAPKRAQNVSPLLTARWDQTQPFWNNCVFNGTQCLTGCPATSLAQVFHYWKYPTSATPSIASYYISGLGTIPALPSTTFDWANMRDYYGWSGSTGTTAQKAAVAELMRYIGQAEHMDYGPNGSGISSSRTDLIASACKTFGYDNNVQAIYKQSAWGTNIYSDSQWASMIQAELEAGHPIVYCGLSNNAGHAFNVDGYTVSTNKYHINWGWSGSGNGDFALNAFTDYDGETYNQYQSMVIGIQPPGGQVTFPVLTVEPTSLDFGSIRTGETVTRTFQVSGINMLGGVTFSKSSSANYYRVSPDTLTAEQVAAGATVTVTYAPTSGGTHEGTISVMSPGAETKSVTVTGTATAVPTINANPSELSFNTEVGQPVTGTFNLIGYNLTGMVYLKVVNSTGGFTIDKSNVTKAAALNGVEVTVTYNPNSLGNHSARVMLRSAGADTIYVQLNGTAAFNKYAPVMQAANEQYISNTSFRADWTDQTPAAGVSSYTLQCNNVAGGAALTFNDITSKFYTIENLTAGATYTYKVKAFYVDGTESDWSNTQQVTLLAGHDYEPGDANHDHNVTISDISALIDYLLGNNNGICTICADVNGDSNISIGDVTQLIDILLNK